MPYATLCGYKSCDYELLWPGATHLLLITSSINLISRLHLLLCALSFYAACDMMRSSTKG